MEKKVIYFIAAKCAYIARAHNLHNFVDCALQWDKNSPKNKFACMFVELAEALSTGQ